MRRMFAATVVASLLLIAAPAHAGAAYHVAIDDFFFSPASKTVPVSMSISFAWDNGGSFAHTATSDVAGFIGTGSIGPGSSGVDSLFGAGTYPYHCNIHSDMHGTVRVRPTASATTITLGSSVTIGIGALQKGHTFDLSRRRNGGAFIVMKSMTGMTSVTFKPSRIGTYEFRARTHEPGGHVSGYSPLRKVEVTAA